MRISRLILLLCISMPVLAQNSSVFRGKAYEHAAVSVCVLDLKSNVTVAQVNKDLSVTPASVLKILTTAVILDKLGPDFRFETKLLTSGIIENSSLKGDLWVQGSGDPSLGSRQVSAKPDAFLEQWVNAIRAAGITRVEGRILVDASAFDDEGVSPFWLWEDIGNYYATGVYGVNVFDNSFKLELKSGMAGSKPEIKDIQPFVPRLTIENQLVAVNNEQDSAYLYGAPFQNEMRLFGSMPANRSSFTIRGQLPDPASYLAYRIKEEFIKAGIQVDGEARSTRLLNEKRDSPRTLLCKTKSVPLLQMVNIIHEKSDNFYTECLLRQLAVGSNGRPASAREGLRVVRQYWKSKGLDVSALAQYDASGLSPNNRISAQLLAQVLQQMEHTPGFLQTFPLAGKEGTVSGFLKGTRLEGKLRLKSGSNQVVNSYAGYYLKNDRTFAVVIMVNHANTSRSQIRKDIETFLLSL